jgi:7,8-dihydro-6-hydroxymethylpterin-pyrophosphokinase
MIRVVLGLGGNLGDPESAFSRALEALAVDGQVVAASRLWRTCPVG